MFTILRRSIKVVKMTLYQCCIGVRPVPRKPEHSSHRAQSCAHTSISPSETRRRDRRESTVAQSTHLYIILCCTICLVVARVLHLAATSGRGSHDERQPARTTVA
jgi:hypothetical protein